MSQFQVKVKSNFNSNETSAPNLMSRGKKEIKNAFKNNFGVEIEDMYISSSYFEIKKLN